MKYLLTLAALTAAAQAVVIDFFPQTGCQGSRISMTIMQGTCNPLFINKFVRDTASPFSVGLTSCNAATQTAKFALYGPGCNTAMPGVEFTATTTCVSAPFSTASPAFAVIDGLNYLALNLPNSFASYQLRDATCAGDMIEINNVFTSKPARDCETGLNNVTSYTGHYSYGPNSCSLGYYVNANTNAIVEYSLAVQAGTTAGQAVGTSYSTTNCVAPTLGTSNVIPLDGTCQKFANNQFNGTLVTKKTLPTPFPVPAPATTAIACYTGAGASVSKETAPSAGTNYCLAYETLDSSSGQWIKTYLAMNTMGTYGFAASQIGYGTSIRNVQACTTNYCNVPTANSAMSTAVFGFATVFAMLVSFFFNF